MLRNSALLPASKKQLTSEADLIRPTPHWHTTEHPQHLSKSVYPGTEFPEAGALPLFSSKEKFTFPIHSAET